MARFGALTRRLASLQASEKLNGLLTQLDLMGNDSMPFINFVKQKSGAKLELKPDGRQCRTCIFKDTMMDPCFIAINSERRFMIWYKPPLPSGETHGAYC